MNTRRPLLKVKNRLQAELVGMVLAAIMVPTLLFGGALYFLITRLAESPASPSLHEAVMVLAPIVAIVFPVSICMLLLWVASSTNKLVGPIDRMIREMDERIEGGKRGPIVLRPGDRLIPLADRINALLKQAERPEGGESHPRWLTPTTGHQPSPGTSVTREG